MQLFLTYLFLQTLCMFQAAPPPIIRSTQLYIQLLVLSTNTADSCYHGWDGTSPSLPRQQLAAVSVDSTWSCMYSCVHLMMGGGTAWNTYSNHKNKQIKKSCILLAVIWDPSNISEEHTVSITTVPDSGSYGCWNGWEAMNVSVTWENWRKTNQSHWQGVGTHTTSTQPIGASSVVDP